MLSLSSKSSRQLNERDSSSQDEESRLRSRSACLDESDTLNTWRNENEQFHIQVEFTQDFDCEYARNNKACGVKNIRCFPFCSCGGHVVQGFCGQVVEATVIAIS